MKERKVGIEELLSTLREQRNWSCGDVALNLNKQMENQDVLEEDVKKWEIGLKYPDLDMIYELSNLYQVSSDEFVNAKNNSFKNGLLSIQAIKWICYMLNLSIKVAMVLTVLTYILAFVGAFLFFRLCASMI